MCLLTDWFKTLLRKGKSYIERYKIKFSNKYQTKANSAEVRVRANYKKLEVPSLAEGFDETFKVRIVENGEFEIIPHSI